MTEARPSNYWIASNALYITRNANGGPDYLLGNTASGAHILCYMKGINGLEYDAGHNYRRWPLSLTPTHFETHTEKYVYCAIPRPGNAAEMAVIVFPSERLDIYGKNEMGQQIGSEQYYYIWLQGIISSSGVTGANDREWVQHINTGTLASDEAMNAGGDETWWRYSSVDDTVTFLKEIVMDAKSVFHNLKARLLVLAGHELTGVATADTSDEFVDSETLVVTPSYLKKNTEDKFLRKDQDDSTPYSLTVGGNLSVGGILRAVTGYITSLYSNLVQSTNYTGEGIADTGYRLTADDGTGSSALTVDNLHVRKKATFEELEVKKETSVAGNEVRSAAANVINRTDYIDQNGEVIGYSYHQVPWMLRRMPFLLRHKFFGRLRRVRVTIDPERVGDIKKIRCYFLAKDGDRDVKNLWQAHDLVRCQTFNITRSNRYTYIGTASQPKFENVFWWRKVVLVSTSPVAIDDKEYHYFDVSMTDCAAGSDIPCAGDHAVQFGNDSDSERMNLIIQEVNGDDAPAIKAYTGIYTYDLNKCWWGGKPCKMMLSPKKRFEFYGPSFKFVQEYGQAPASIDRGAWVDIPTECDDYEPHAQVRKCYYYDKVSHNGCYWLCVFTVEGDGAHWVDANGNYISDDDYADLPDDQKLLCTRRQDYITSQPGTDDTAWKKLVDKGDNMVRLDIDNEMDTVQTDSTGKVTVQRTVTTVVRLYDGSSEVAIGNPTVTGIAYTDGDGHQQTLQPTITASGNGRQLSWTFQTGWTLQGRYQVSIGYTYQNVAYTAVFTLTASQGMAIFQLKPAMSSIPFQRDADGNLTPASKSLALDIIKIDGASTATITPATYGHTKIRYSLTEMPTLVTSGTAWPSTGSIPVPNTAENVYIALFNIYDGLIDRESVPVIKDGEKGDKGDKMTFDDLTPEEKESLKGENGKDGWMITANPANVIITQSLNNNTSSFSSATVSFAAKKGGTNATITSIDTPTSSEFIVSKSGNTVIVSRPNTHGSPAEYYTEGSFTVTINVTDPDTGSTVSFNVTVLCYANLLGSWKEKVEGGTKTEVARQLTYGYDPDSGQVIPLSTFGEYIKSSEVNISRLEQKSESRNMLDCASGDGWRNWDDDKIARYDNATQKVIGIYNSEQQTTKNLDAYSKAVFLKLGVNYVISLYAHVQPRINIYRLNGNPNATQGVFEENTYHSLTVSRIDSEQYQECYRYKASFVLDSANGDADDYYVIDVYNSSEQLKYFYRPQLEIGDTPTAWVPSSQKNSSSEIKQTADEIELSVRRDLRTTGINIADDEIKLKAGRVKFVDPYGDEYTTPYVEITSDGKIKARDGEFSGKVEVASTRGKWVIEPHTAAGAVPRISGQDGSGNEVMVIYFDSDLDDTTYVRDGGGLIFVDNQNGALASRFCRNAWRTNCHEYGKDNQHLTYIQSLTEETDPRIIIYQNAAGNAKSLTMGANTNGAYLLSSNWMSKANAVEGETYVDAWGNLKVKNSLSYDQFNVRTSSFQLPYGAPVDTIFFCKGFESDMTVTTSAWDVIMNPDNRGTTQSMSFYDKSVFFVKMAQNTWVTFWSE